MYPHQAERLLEALERARLDALVATSPENVAYLTGFRRSTEDGDRAPMFGVFARRGTALVLPAMDAPMVTADAVDHVVCFGGFHAEFPDSPTAETRRLQAIVRAAPGSPAEAVASALERLGIVRGSIGLDESRLTHQGWTGLVDRLAGIEIVAGADHLEAARRVKSPYEIECLAHALRVVEEALDAVIQTIERGMTEREAAALFGAEVVKRGGRPYRATVAMGERSGIPAPWPTDRALRTGDLVRFDVGCLSNGYCSSIGRTAVLGQVGARQEAVYRALQTGLETAVAAVTPGVPGACVFEAAMAAVRADGLPRYRRDDIGHGIGLEPREPPALGPGSRAPLEMGEVLCIEMSYCEIETTGVSVKNTVLVTSAGARVLNRSRHDLVVLD